MIASRKEFYFRHQRGCCYLQIKGDCRRHDGVMTMGLKGHAAEQRDATWEHLFSRVHAGARGPGRQLQLLACAGCNHLKGESHIATAAQIAYAKLLRKVWTRIAGGQAEDKAFKSVGAPWSEVDGKRVFTLTLPVEYGMPVDRRPSRAPHLFLKFCPIGDVDDDVPETLGEALAQGGIQIVVRRPKTKPWSLDDERRLRNRSSQEAAARCIAERDARIKRSR